jgi:hypothetical protein
MAAIETSAKNVYDGCNYYLMCKIKGNDWDCIINKSFILHTNDGKLYGQFLSSMWFKKHISIDDVFDLLVIRLPRRDTQFHPDEQVTIDILKERLSELDECSHVSGDINYDILDFVVIHKHYRSDITKYTCNILNDQLVNGETRSVITDSTIFSAPNYSNINMTFEVVRSEDTQSNIVQDITNPPQLIRNDGSWNSYRHSLSNDDVKFYITCPQFTLNIA